MKRIKQFLTAALLAVTAYAGWACAREAEATVTAPRAPASAALISAIGDTLNYRLSWGSASGATGYTVTVRATGASFSGLPTNAAVATTAFSFSAIATAPYDSVTFTAVVKGTRGTRVSRDSSTVTWKYVKPLGAPGPITVDSSLIPVAVNINPKSLITLAGMQTQFCSLITFADGRMGIRSADPSACQQRYAELTPVAYRATADQQRVIDQLCMLYSGGTTSDAVYSAGAGGTLSLQGLYTPAAVTQERKHRVIVTVGASGCGQAQIRPGTFFARARITGAQNA